MKEQLPPFENLVKTHTTEIFGYLWRMLRNTQDAEDCLQITFLRAYKAYPTFKPGSNARAWLYKISTNVAYTFTRRRNKQENHLQHLTFELPASQPDISDRIIQTEFLQEVVNAANLLPYKQRAALLMRKYQGLSYAEIADALSCSQDSARANVYQALKKLREQFDE